MRTSLISSLTFLIALFSFPFCSAQGFINLTADQVKVDSLLPVYTYSHFVGSHYTDSVYTATIEYPEFIPVNAAEAARCQQLGDQLPELPDIVSQVSVSRRQGTVHFSLVPLVFRDGSYQKLVSFKLHITARPVQAMHRANADSTRYAANSVLRSGSWAKIRIPSTGIYQLTDALVRQAGFSNLNKVHIYGYGGALQPEKLTPEYLAATDDLQEVPTCTVGNRRLFYGIGPVSWDTSNRRVRNPYSQYGYYFLTESDEQPLSVSDSTFLANNYPLADDYNTLYETDDYAWFHGGRNLYDSRELTAGNSREYTLASTGNSTTGTLTVSLSANMASTVYIQLNGRDVLLTDSTKGYVSIAAPGNYDKMRTNIRTFQVNNLQAENKIVLTNKADNGVVRLDYLSIHADKPFSAPDLSKTFPTPEYLYHITNQNHHATTAADMVIIIPTSQKLASQAQRLKEIHERYDSLRVQIVPADELFNEFSSGTPDANAYRRYLKMLYDRAATDADMPRYLLLMGDAAWDNRMLISDWKNCSPDDFLLCYESENSYSEVDCYVSDDYFCMLDDNEGGNLLASDKADIAVGRISARSADEAKIAVDKIENYIKNTEAGSWQNVICFMGDDGNENMHMMDADSVAQMVEQLYPSMQVRRIMWDAYTRTTSSTGNSYPDVTRLIKQQVQRGALIMNYSGHGRADAISHEYVLKLPDFEAFSSPRLPLWLTASCDIMPFDGQEENIGETSIFNSRGGAIAFFGTTRTVYQSYNRLMNLSFTRHVLSRDAEGRPLPIGEAVRQTKNELISTGIVTGYSNGKPVYSTDKTANKLQYTLLGDPALRLAVPTMSASIDSINGHPASTAQTLPAGSIVTVIGHVSDADGTPATQFNGMVTAVVSDAKQTITCKRNDPNEAEEAFVFQDHPNILFNGSESVTNGRFTFTFVVPKDITYSDASGLISLYAISNDKQQLANGYYDQFSLNGSSTFKGDGSGPAIYCYLNYPSFPNGGSVNRTPYFIAEVADEDGINASGSGIGHDLQLAIDGNQTMTYSLNDYFQFDFGSYTTGRIGYSIPELDYGEHTLQFRAWDVLNNSTTVTLSFNVVKGLQPSISRVSCTDNPASTHTTFIINHDRSDSNLDVVLEIFDASGRQLWSHAESGTSTGSTYKMDWDLTTDGGRRLRSGLYLYRIRVASEGSSYSSAANKLIIR